MTMHCPSCFTEWQEPEWRCFACGKGGYDGWLLDDSGKAYPYTSMQVAPVRLSDEELAQELVNEPPYWLQ